MSRTPVSIVRPEQHQADGSIVLVKAVQTCLACPSQWDAWDADGTYYYLRHRNGRGSVDSFADPNPETWGAGQLGEIAHFRGEYDWTADHTDMDELAWFCGEAGLTLADDFQLVTYQKYIERLMP